MFGIGTVEFVIIAIVALIVVGPKDLPVMFKTVGRYVGRARAMARDFQRTMEDAADEAGVKDIQRDLRQAGDMSRNPLRSATESMKKYSDDIMAPLKDAEGAARAPARPSADAPARPAAQGQDPTVPPAAGAAPRPAEPAKPGAAAMPGDADG